MTDAEVTLEKWAEEVTPEKWAEILKEWADVKQTYADNIEKCRVNILQANFYIEAINAHLNKDKGEL